MMNCLKLQSRPPLHQIGGVVVELGEALILLDEGNISWSIYIPSDRSWGMCISHVHFVYSTVIMHNLQRVFRNMHIACRMHRTESILLACSWQKMFLATMATGVSKEMDGSSSSLSCCHLNFLIGPSVTQYMVQRGVAIDYSCLPCKLTGCSLATEVALRVALEASLLGSHLGLTLSLARKSRKACVLHISHTVK